MKRGAGIGDQARERKPATTQAAPRASSVFKHQKNEQKTCPKISQQSQAPRCRTVKELHSPKFPFSKSERVQGFALR